MTTSFARRTWLVILTMLAMAGSSHAAVLFHADFDQGLRATYSAGDPRPVVGSFKLTTGGPAMAGEALDATRAGRLAYKAEGQVDFNRGAVSLALHDPGVGVTYPFFLSADGAATTHLQDGLSARITHGQAGMADDEALWRITYNGRHFEARVRRNTQGFDHVAITWDMTAGAGKGVVAFYWNGRQVARESGFSAITQVGPQARIIIGSHPASGGGQAGVIDQFQIRDTPDPAPAALPAAPVGPPPFVSPVRNGGFEQWTQGKPDHWQVVHGAYEPDTAMRVTGERALRMATRRDQPGLFLGTSVSQEITLEPHTQYDLRFMMAKHGPGKVVVQVIPMRQGKPVGGQMRLDWNNGWTSFFAWSPVELAFRTGDHDQYLLRINQYGNPDGPAWLDDVTILPAGGLDRQPDAREVSQGFMLSQASPMIPIEEDHKPRHGSAVDRLRIVMARDEYEPGVVALHALKPLEQVELRLAGDLIGQDDAQSLRLKAGQVVIRQWRDGLLPMARPTSVAQDRHLVWWVTVHAPQATQPGRYVGELEVLVAGRRAASLPVEVEVLPLVLPQPAIPLLAYHAEYYFPPGFLSADQRMAYYRDMREHGMTTVTVYNNPDAGQDKVDLSRNYRDEPVGLEGKPDDHKVYHYTLGEMKQRFEWGLEDVMPLIRQSGLADTGQPIMWLINKKDYGFGAAPPAKLKAMVDQWRQQKDWPEPLLYIIDEPKGNPDRIALARHLFDRMKHLDLSVRKVTAGVAVEELGDDYDVWVQHNDDVNEWSRQDARRKDAELWVYNCNVPADNAPFTRALYGFWAYRAGVQGIALWAYYDAKNWYMDADGQIHGGSGAGLSRICPSPDGPVPTVSWETTREGVDDYRYAMLLDALIHQAADRTATLRRQAQDTLGRDTVKLLDQKRDMLARRLKEGETLPDWQPANDAQRRAASNMLAAHELEDALRLAKLARERLIETIPADAMAIQGGLPFSAQSSTYYPVLDHGDPRTVGERKRQVLQQYMVNLHQLMQKHGRQD